MYINSLFLIFGQKQQRIAIAPTTNAGKNEKDRTTAAMLPCNSGDKPAIRPEQHMKRYNRLQRTILCIYNYVKCTEAVSTWKLYYTVFLYNAATCQKQPIVRCTYSRTSLPDH